MTDPQPGDGPVEEPVRRSLGCAGCGDCCDPVYLDPYFAAKVDDARARAERGEPVVPEAGSDSLPFILEHWTEIDRTDGGASYSCDRFDPVTRQCGDHEARPDVCRRFPWYDEEPRADLFPPDSRCSYLLEVPRWQRPDARPLIPITPVAG